MSLLDQLNTGIDTAWNAMADLLVPVAYTAIKRGSYSPSTGVVSQTSTITQLKAALVDYSDTTRSGSDIEAGDRRALIRASDLPGQPQPGDTLAVAGVVWSVVSVNGDPRVFHDLQVRR